jgi:hypothetical protein
VLPLCPHIEVPGELEQWLSRRPSIPTVEDIRSLKYHFPKEIEPGLFGFKLDFHSLDECRAVLDHWAALLRDIEYPLATTLVNWQVR